MASGNGFTMDLQNDGNQMGDEADDAVISVEYQSDVLSRQGEATDEVPGRHVTGMSGGVAIDSIVTGINYGRQSITVKASDPVKQKAVMILDRTISRIRDWTKGMAQTSALEKVLHKVNSGTRWITIKGSPGEGKTTVAYMALEQLHRKDRQVFDVISPEEFSDVTMTFPESVVMLDDIFGSLEFNYVEWSRWKPILQQVLGLTEHGCTTPQKHTSSTKDVTVILVGRDYVLNSARYDMGRMSDFFTLGQHVVTISQQTERKLEEKLAILNAVSGSIGTEVDEVTRNKMCSISCPHGFPHVCRLFLTLHKSNPQLTVDIFFKAPLEFLNQTICAFTRDKLKLFVFKEMLKGSGKLSVRGLGQLESGSDIILAAFDLVGTYLKKADDHFVFDHPSVYDSVAYNISKLYPQFVIENCDLSFIHERIRIQFSQTTQNSLCKETILVAYLPRVYSDDLAKRFATEIMNRKFLLVLSHEALAHEEFVRQLMSYITIPFGELIHMYNVLTDEYFLSLIASNRSPQLLRFTEKSIHLSQDDVDDVLFGVCRYAASDVLTHLTDVHDTLDINCRFDDEQTPLMIAAETRDKHFVHHVMSLDPDIDAHDIWGKTAFMCFCEYGLLSAVECSADRGSDIDKMDGEGRSPLYFACAGNQTEIVRFLLDRGARVDDRVVAMACSVGNMVIVRWLFESGAKVNTLSGWGTPLHSACYMGRINVITFLIEKGASVNAEGLSEMSPLHVACMNNKFQAVECLLENEAVVDSRDRHGDTPLHTATDANARNCISLLLLAGADINVQNTSGLTPLHKASARSTDTVDILLKAGARIDVDENGCTPLHTAASCGYDKNISFLLKAQADFNVQSKDGSTALHEASRVGSKSSIAVLLKAGADPQLQDKHGNTALHKAAKTWSSDCVVLLVEAGADVHMRNKEGSTPLHLSSRKCVDVLLKEGTDINVQDRYGDTALHIAVRTETPEHMCVLLENGAGVNIQNTDGLTPLHIAVRRETPKDISVLLETGADVNIQNTDGLTPLHIAAGRKSPTCVDMLLKAGGDVNIESKDKLTPLHTAVSCIFQSRYIYLSDVSLCRTLLQHGASVNAQDRVGNTPLHLLCRDNRHCDLPVYNDSYRTLVTLLIDHGADVNAYNNKGQKALYGECKALVQTQVSRHSKKNCVVC